MFFVLFFFTLIKTLIATDLPIIGILSEEAYPVNEHFPGYHYDSFIAAANVKFLESAGARVVPIWIGQNRSYYERAVDYTNGILFPGGGTNFDDSRGYADAVRFIYTIAKDRNDKGTYYPLMGICLGMETMAFASSHGEDARTGCRSKKVSLPLNFETDFQSSRLFKEAPEEILNILKTNNVTYNYHELCLTEESLRKYNVSSIWRIISRNKDVNGKQFISSMEVKNYPFFALQFHPEKLRYEYKDGLNIPHTLNGNKVSQYFADFFIQESIKNKNKFPNESIEQKSMIYNFHPAFTPNTFYYQMYLFKKEDYLNHQLI